MRRRSFTIVFIVLLLIVVLLAGLAAGFYYEWPRYFEREISPTLMDASFVAGEFSESDDEIANPYRGWYRLFGYVLDDDGRGASDLNAHLKDANFPLVQIEINLRNYADGEISGAALSQLNLILDTWQNAGHQVLLRFAYDFDGRANSYEPTDLNIVLSHMRQVADVVNAHKKSIFLMQGLFVGECGEMHGTPLCTDENYVVLYQTLDEAIDPDIFLSVRTPSHFATVTGISQESVREGSVDSLVELFRDASSGLPGDSADLYGGNSSGRIHLGLFNDGMMGSENDLGTYEDRGEGIAFQKNLCLFVPNGGEAVVDNPFNDIDNALVDMAAMHITYLNIAHDGEVIAKWRESFVNLEMLAGGGSADVDGSSVGMDGFSYITSHLGYRFFVTDASFVEWDEDAQTARISFSVENEGFAPAYVPFTADVSVVDVASGSEVRRISLSEYGCDVRDWRPGETTEVGFDVELADLPEGEYELTLSLYDERQGCGIGFTNGGSEVFLGTVSKIHREVDPWDYAREYFGRFNQ